MQRTFKRSDHHRSSAINRFYLTGFAACLFLISGCDLLLTNWDTNSTPYQYPDNIYYVKTIWPHYDVSYANLTYCDSTLTEAIIPTLTYNYRTVWPQKYTAIANDILEKAKDPGLGVRSLHAKGITGEGVTVAMIGNGLPIKNPELEKITCKSRKFGTSTLEFIDYIETQMFNFLADPSIGVAPKLKFFFASVEQWDAKSFAAALRWLINENSQLSDNNKIRAVLLTYFPSSSDLFSFSNRSTLDSAMLETKKAGITILYYSPDERKTGVCYYSYQNPDSLEDCDLEYITPNEYSALSDTNKIYIPVSRRSLKFYDSTFSYAGYGKLEWTIPYLTGVLALGWQVRPDLTGDKLISLVFSSAYRKKDRKIINPVAFIDSVSSFRR